VHCIPAPLNLVLPPLDPQSSPRDEPVRGAPSPPETPLTPSPESLMLTPAHHPTLLVETTYSATPDTAAPDVPASVLAPPVSPRAGAAVDATLLRLRDEAAVKHNTFPSRPGRPSGAAHWQTHLHVEAWVRNTTFAKHVWADVHVFGHDGALVASVTLPLVYERPAGDGGDVFRLDHAVYEGATATPGSVAPRPDVRRVQFRLYCELEGRVVTDGVAHDCVLRPDAVSG